MRFAVALCLLLAACSAPASPDGGEPGDAGDARLEAGAETGLPDAAADAVDAAPADVPNTPDAADVREPDVAADASCGPCLATETCCAGVCVNTNGSDSNCGMCGRACRSDLTCNGGSCGCAHSLCGDLCVDLDTDANNCGACGRQCAAGQHCVFVPAFGQGECQ